MRAFTTIVVLGFGLSGVVAFGACNARVVDVGLNDAAAGAAALGPGDATTGPSQYGCAEWIDEELYALREGVCAGTCSSEGASAYPLDTKKNLIAASAGQWLYCQGPGMMGPADAVGVEFAPGCRLYFLRFDTGGAIVRGTEARFQARYDIIEPRPPGLPRQIDVHIDDERTITFDVDAYRCPERMRLVSSERTIELSPDVRDAGGRPDPTR